MKVFAISDFHLSFDCDKPMDIFGGNWEGYTDKIKENLEKKVSDDDIVLIAGDISWAMKPEEAKKDIEWIENLPGTKIMIRGNHDFWWKSVSFVRSMVNESIKVIQNDSLKIGNYVFCGSRGWIVPDEKNEITPEDEKIYKREVERLKLSLMSAENLKSDGDKIVLMIHYPPFNSKHDDNEFTKLFEKYGVDKVIFGHLHGYSKCDLVTEKNGISYYLTSCDKINNEPVLIYE